MVEMNKTEQKKILRGRVISNKMKKTVVVEHERSYRHPEVHKVLKTTKKYKVHDEQGLAKVGDIVEFYEGRPVSKTKYMHLASIVTSQANS